MRLKSLISTGLLGAMLLMFGGMSMAQTTDNATTITYQGFLTNSSGPVNGLCNFEFSLFDALTEGNQIGATLNLNGLNVINGDFIAPLDFGADAFNGEDRFLEIGVQCSGDAMVTLLSPRQPITPAAYAIYALGVDWANVENLPAGFADGVDNTGWDLNGNAGTTPGTDFIGTTDDTALEFYVNSLRALRIEPNATAPNIIGGHVDNIVAVGVVGATINGGGPFGSDGANRVIDDFGTIGGGTNNLAGDEDGTGTYATVGGGLNNQAIFQYATVGGGFENIADGLEATVAGGWQNKALDVGTTIGGGYQNEIGGSGSNARQSTIGGGSNNEVFGQRSTIPGGFNNTVNGDYSFAVGWNNTALGDYSYALGRSAYVGNSGAFVWADGSNTQQFGSATANSFAVRAVGGVRFVTGVDANNDPTAGVFLSAGSGTWGNYSDVNVKSNFEDVDVQAVLDSLLEIPITTWNYNAQDEAIRHIGPMAQDFYAAFGVGDNDVTITTVDAQGVAFAAIQGLAAQVEAQDAEIAALEARLEALENNATTNNTSPWMNWLPVGLVLLGMVAVGTRRRGAAS